MRRGPANPLADAHEVLLPAASAKGASSSGFPLDMIRKANRRKPCPKQQLEWIVRYLDFSISRVDAKSIATTVCAPRSLGVGLIVTPNLDHIVNLRRNVEFANAYRWAAITVCDGFPVQYYAKLRGIPVKRVTGCDIINELMSIAGPSQRFFFVVDSDQTATAVKKWGEFRQIAVGTSVPPRGFENDLAKSKYLFDQIREHHTTILIMGVGAPKSEVWVWRHQHQLPNCWALCLGQAVRTALGLTTRAPKLVRTLHGEWLWRIFQEPRRLAGRYIRGSVMFLVAIFEDLTGSKSQKIARIN